jgi:DNA-binding transcriptional LysR family regulator
MDTRFLTSLATVIECGSIAEAARRENLTAAAISQRIKTLEAILKCSLLIRTGHSAKPTSECLRLLPKLQQIEQLSAQLQDDLDTTGLTGTLKVGVISSVLSGCFPKCIQTLNQQAPNILLKIIPGSSEQLYSGLTKQKIDLAILVEAPFKIPKVLQFETLFTEPLLFISRNAQQSRHHALQELPFIQYDKGSWGGAIANSYLQDNAISTNTLCEIDALETIVMMVSQGIGVSLIPHWRGLSQLNQFINSEQIEGTKYQRSIGILSHRQNSKAPLLKKFHQVLQEVVNEFPRVNDDYEVL